MYKLKEYFYRIVKFFHKLLTTVNYNYLVFELITVKHNFSEQKYLEDKL